MFHNKYFFKWRLVVVRKQKIVLFFYRPLTISSLGMRNLSIGTVSQLKDRI